MSKKKSDSNQDLFSDVIKEEQPEATIKPKLESEAYWKPAASQKAKAGPSAGNQGDWVVVAEDSPTNLRILESIFTKLKVGTHGFRNGADALDFIKTADASVYGNVVGIFADIDMPKLNGIRLLEEVRKIEHSRLTPFVVLAERNEAKIVQMAVQQGILGQIVKPIASEQVNELITKVLSQRKKSA